MQNIINVGDEIENWQGKKVLITSVITGKHGLSIIGNFILGSPFQTYLPFELPR